MTSVFGPIQNFFVPPSLGFEIVHPFIITRFATFRVDDDTRRTEIEAQSYPDQLSLNVNQSSVHFNNDGSGNLSIEIGDESFTLPDFEDGRLINGVGLFSDGLSDQFDALDPDLFDISFSVNLGRIVAGVTGPTDLVFFENGIQETYFLNSVTYADGSEENLRNGVRILGFDDRDDVLVGFDINDVSGLAYNDVLDGRGGDDNLFGGDGNDTYIFSSSFGVDRIRDADHGNGFSDTIVLSDITDITQVSVLRDQFNTSITIEGTDDSIFIVDQFSFGEGIDAGVQTLRLGNGSEFNLSESLLSFGTAAADNFRGSATADVLDGRGGDDIIQGLEGDDQITGGAGADILNGGDGNDTASYSEAPGSVEINLETGVNVGNDAQDDVLISIENLVGSTFGDVFVATNDTVANLFVGNGGDDILSSFGGDDVIIGGAGGDILDGGDGIDTLSYATDTTGVKVFLDTGLAAFGHAAGDVNSNFENIVGGSARDIFRGTNDTNVIDAGDGDNTVNALGGDDTVFGGNGTDRLLGSTGNDLLHAVGGTNNALIGGGGQDILNGAEDRDILRGEASADILTGNAGNDVYFGGFGADRFVFNANDGDDVINDFEDNLGNEKIDLSSIGITFGDLTIIDLGASGDSRIDYGTGTIRVNDTLAADLGSDDFIFF